MKYLKRISPFIFVTLLFSCEKEEATKTETKSTGKSGLALKTEINTGYDDVIVGGRVNNAALAGYKGAIYNSETYELVMEIDDFSTIDDVIPLDAGSYRLTCTTKDVDTSFSFIEGAKSGVIKFEIEESTITETKLYIYNDNSNSGGYGNSKIKINYSQSFLNQFGDNYKAVYTADYTERNYKQNTSTGELTLGSEKSFDIQVNFEDSDSLFLNMYEYTFYGDVQNKTISKKHSNGIISITAGTNKISTILDKSVLEAGIYYIINVDYKSLKGGLEMNVVIDNSYEKKIFDVVFTDEEQ